jgi:EH domain-containing protein 1
MFSVFCFQTATKQIALNDAEISESNIDKKEHTFRIKAKENNRNFYMQADSENTQHEWMQAICFAKAAGRDGENSQACVIQ